MEKEVLTWDKEENKGVGRDYSLCSLPDVIYAIITEYVTHNLNRAQLCFKAYFC